MVSFIHQLGNRPDTVVLTGYTYIWTVPEYGVSADSFIFIFDLLIFILCVFMFCLHVCLCWDVKSPGAGL